MWARCMSGQRLWFFREPDNEITLRLLPRRKIRHYPPKRRTQGQTLHPSRPTIHNTFRDQYTSRVMIRNNLTRGLMQRSTLHPKVFKFSPLGGWKVEVVPKDGPKSLIHQSMWIPNIQSNLNITHNNFKLATWPITLLFRRLRSTFLHK